jgi:hypothetical protein
MVAEIAAGAFGLLMLLSVLADIRWLLRARRRVVPEGSLLARCMAVHMAAADPRSRWWRHP